ncbi:hairy-related 3 [Halichoeres trimaculatus]|uniref:hairy-related 3 n=1 Tax=Halichoeres trimaculatus TaxID=147232 RepID=UPI003D9F1F5C
MVATTDCAVKSKTLTGNKVSKPQMEKKRRARINKCLDQLKCLLESYYSSSIRKRKLEKADILELTVKHLRNLQKIQSCAASASEFSDYQMGFRNCMANVNQYLMMADKLNGSDNWMLSQLSCKLSRSRGRGEAFSTMDSGPGQAEARNETPRLLPPVMGPESRKPATSSPCKDSQQPKVTKKDEDCMQAPKQNSHEHGSSHKKSLSVSHRNEAAHTQENMWRPW